MSGTKRPHKTPLLKKINIILIYFVQKLNLFFSLREGKALRNRSLIKGGYY